MVIEEIDTRFILVVKYHTTHKIYTQNYYDTRNKYRGNFFQDYNQILFLWETTLTTPITKISHIKFSIFVLRNILYGEVAAFCKHGQSG